MCFLIIFLPLTTAVDSDYFEKLDAVKYSSKRADYLSLIPFSDFIVLIKSLKLYLNIVNSN
jgi:hypothetical protein